MFSKDRLLVSILFLIGVTVQYLTVNTSAHLRYVINATEVAKVGTGLPYGLDQADRLGVGMLVGLVLVSSIQLAGPRLSQTMLFTFIRGRLESIGPYSPSLARVLVGLLLVASGHTGTLLTPQFGAPLQGVSTTLVWAQYLAGVLFLLGLATGLASVIFALVYLSTFLFTGVHGLDHLAMLGLAIFLFVEGGGPISLDHLLARASPKVSMLASGLKRYREYSLPGLRITLGVSLVWLGLTEKVLAPALTSYAIVKYGVPYFPDLTVFTFVFGVFEIFLGFHFVLGLFNRVIAAIYLGLLIFAVPIFGEWINHFYLFAATILILTRGAGSFRVDVQFI